ncbi:MAG: PaaI family thioesterase [Spirochaetaceae bacterium]
MASLPLPAAHTFEAWQQWFAAFADRTAVGFHGIELVSVDDEGLVLRMPIGPHALQPYGLLHGGMNMLLMESAASLHACWKVDLTRRIPVGIEINGSHLRSATDGVVLAAATEIRRSRTIAHHEITITQQETGKSISVGRMTNLYVDA